MKKIKNVIISYWYKELDINPLIKINDLENSLKNSFIVPFFVNNMPVGVNISLPRIEAFSETKDIVFGLSLVNANISIAFNDNLGCDDIILMINEKVQLFFDIIKEVYNTDIIYTSIKIEMIEIMDDASDYLKKLWQLDDDNYEDLSFKKSIRKDNVYYINYFTSNSREINFNFEVKNNVKPQQKDIIDRSMLISLMDANIINNYVLTTIEINDRLAYNSDNKYLTTKENIRGMIVELKSILKKKVN